MALRLTLTIFGLVTSSVAFANPEPTCVPKLPKKSAVECYGRKCSSEERLLSIEFPDHRKIYVLGHDHGNRDENDNIYSSLISGPFDRDTVAKKIASAHEAMTQPIDQNKDDLKLLNKILKTNKLEFIGAEVDSARYDYLSASYQPSFALLRNVTELNKIDSSLIEDILKVIIPLPMYLDLYRPNELENMRFLGFESRRLMDAENSADKIAEKFRAETEKIFAADAEVLKQRIDVWSEIKALRMLDRLPSPAEESRALEKIRLDAKLGENSQVVVNYVRSLLNSSKASIARDEYVAHGLAARKQSGIQFVGHSHLLSLGRFLAAECTAEVRK